MKKFSLSVLFILSIYTVAIAQGIVRGKITDISGETQIGVTIVVKSNPSVGTVTDLDGNYSLKINDSVPQIILVSFISYNTIEEIVHPVNGEVLVKNYFLVPASMNIKEVEVTAKAIKAREYYTEMIKKNSAPKRV